MLSVISVLVSHMSRRQTHSQWVIVVLWLLTYAPFSVTVHPVDLVDDIIYSEAEWGGNKQHHQIKLPGFHSNYDKTASSNITHIIKGGYLLKQH